MSSASALRRPGSTLGSTTKSANSPQAMSTSAQRPSKYKRARPRRRTSRENGCRTASTCRLSWCACWSVWQVLQSKQHPCMPRQWKTKLRCQLNLLTAWQAKDQSAHIMIKHVSPKSEYATKPSNNYCWINRNIAPDRNGERNTPNGTLVATTKNDNSTFADVCAQALTVTCMINKSNALHM